MEHKGTMHGVGRRPLTRRSRKDSLRPVQRSPFHATIKRGHTTVTTAGLAVASPILAVTSLPPMRAPPLSYDHDTHA